MYKHMCYHNTITNTLAVTGNAHQNTCISAAKVANLATIKIPILMNPGFIFLPRNVGQMSKIKHNFLIISEFLSVIFIIANAILD